MSKPKFYITTAIDYVNSPPHLGTAYEKVTADVIARYKRLAGFDVHFLMGNDEHSLNVFKKAQELDKDPIAYTDEMETVFRNVWDRLEISYDDFIRTTQERHAKGVVHLLEKIDEAGDIFEGEYEGWYCVSCESFKTEADLNDDGNCSIHQDRKPEWIQEKNYFFKLSKYKEPLLKYYEEHPELLEPSTRRNEVLNMIADVQDVSISRASQAWGIPLPQDSNAVIYVWFDALINYISAVGFGYDDDTFAKWWPADLHVIGKDITRFHNVIWPAMLMSAGVPLPHRVFAHGWVNFQGRKMSKSDGTVVDPLEAADTYGPDPLRLYLVREIAYGNDGDFSWDRFEERYNADLANNFGNLVNRIAGMAGKYRGGDLPQVSESGPLAEAAASAVARYRKAMDAYALHEGAAAAFGLLDATNEYIQESEPWALAKDEANAEKLSAILYDVAEAIRIGAILLLPVMPDSCATVLERIGAPKPAAEHTLEDAQWNCAGGRRTSKGEAIWPRLERD